MKAVSINKRNRTDPLAELLGQTPKKLQACHVVVSLCRVVHLKTEGQEQTKGLPPCVICLEGFDTTSRYHRVYIADEETAQMFSAVHVKVDDPVLLTYPRKQAFFPIASCESRDPDGVQFTALLLGPLPNTAAVMERLGLSA